MRRILDIIGDNVKRYREIKAITQEELSLLCGLHRNYISSVEKGRRNLTLSSLERISYGLNVNIKDLL
ncbi:MAG: helix-turn-helix transcriptional regulator [Microgenomates group bacterium]